MPGNCLISTKLTSLYITKFIICRRDLNFDTLDRSLLSCLAYADFVVALTGGSLHQSRVFTSISYIADTHMMLSARLEGRHCLVYQQSQLCVI